jgi:hypothetical protein
MKRSMMTVALTKDPEAPTFSAVDFGLEADRGNRLGRGIGDMALPEFHSYSGKPFSEHV